jgi:homoserine dehydrogenase
MMKTIGIGILGLGTVGSAVYRLIKEKGDDYSKRFGIKPEVRKVLVRNLEKQRTVAIPQNLLTTKFNDVLNDKGVDIIVEVMGGVAPAFDYVTMALRNGKPVVTANKHMLAENGEEIEALSRDKGVAFRFEASVGGIIPIVAGLNEGLHSLDIVKVRGILNGTTNFILSSMRFDGMEYDEALKMAQEKGFAEPDPKLDVEGYDTAHKLCVLSRLAFGKFLPLSQVKVKGIGPETKTLIAGAIHLGRNVRLVGTLSMVGIGPGTAPTATVAPEEVVKEDPLFNINGSMNCIALETRDTGTITLSGRGAGGKETATAIVNDILAIAVQDPGK